MLLSSNFRPLRKFLAFILTTALVFSLLPMTVIAATDEFSQFANSNLEWINGNLNASKSAYSEGMSVPQRLILGDMSAGERDHYVTFSYGFTKGGKYAYDFLTSWDQAILTANDIGNQTWLDEWKWIRKSDETLASRLSGNFGTAVIPGTPLASAKEVAYQSKYGNRTLTIYGNAPVGIVTIDAPVFSGSTSETSEYALTVHWTGAATEVMILFGAHIAVGVNEMLDYEIEWGPDSTGASSISGSPYHVSLVGSLSSEYSGQTSRDNQLQTVYIPTQPEKIDITGTKIWVGGPTPRPTIQLQLYRDAVALGSPVDLASGTTTYTWTGLDKTTSAGVPYAYTVDEVATPANYTRMNPDALTVTNTYVPPQISVTGTKNWVNGPATKPTIQLQLYRNAVAFGDPVTLASGTTTYTWTGLDATNINGVPYTYTVDEVATPTNYTRSNPDALTVTNTYVPPTTSITGTKIWVNGPSPKPDIQLQLYRNGSPFGDAVTLSDGTTTHTWSGLAATDLNGNAYNFSVNEVATPTNYARTNPNALTVTNTYVPPQTSITGTKIWVNGPTLKPTIQLQLFRNGLAFGSPVSLASGTTTYTWNGLDTTDLIGNPYTYSVNEVATPNNYTRSNPDSLTVTNTYNPAHIDITGTKIWVNGPSPKPTIQLQLFRDGSALGAPVSLADGTTTYTWAGLDETASNGIPYVYTVDEVATPTNYTRSNPNALTVTNTYNPPLTSVTGTKNWVGGPSPKPTIQLQLFRDGRAFGDPVSLNAGTTTYTWTNLVATDINGAPYTFTVDEVTTPSNYTRTNPNSLTVTNTYVPPQTSITGTKIWVNGPEVKPTIQLQLFRDDIAFGDPVSLADGTTTYTWNELDATDLDGVPYVYSVDEVATPSNYTRTNPNALTVTNTFEPTLVDITGTKIWVGGPTPRPTIQLQLFRDDVAIGDPVSLTSGQTSYTWAGLAETASNGIPYVYSVDEVATPASYVRTNPNALTVTNTYTVPPVPGINIVKTSTTAEVNTINQVVPYTFTVTNTGNVALTNIIVTDPNLTTGPIYVSGDTNGDAALDLTETWIYSGTRVIPQSELESNGGGDGLIDNTATVTGTPPVGPNVNDTDTYSIPINLYVPTTSLTVAGATFTISPIAVYAGEFETGDSENYAFKVIALVILLLSGAMLALWSKKSRKRNPATEDSTEI